jgi:uncharacterized damage-inducible protein DinB
MDSIALIRRLHQHRAWVNGNLLAAAARLTETQLRQQFAIGQGSIWQSLCHLYAAENVWLEVMHGNEEALTKGDLPGKLTGNQLGEGAVKSLPELKKEWSALSTRWDKYLSSLTAGALDDLVYRKRAGTSERFGTRRADVLMHVCTHAQYTTAQVVNMLRQCGIAELPAVMLIQFARQESASSILSPKR